MVRRKNTRRKMKMVYDVKERHVMRGDPRGFEEENERGREGDSSVSRESPTSVCISSSSSVTCPFRDMSWLGCEG